MRQIKCQRNNEKGAITLYVLLTCLFLVFILTGIYVSNLNKIQTQEEQVKQIQKNYAKQLERKDEIIEDTENSTVYLTIKQNPENHIPVTDEVILTATARTSKEELKIVACSFDGENNWTEVPNLRYVEQTKTVTENGIYTFYVKDNDGKIWSISQKVTNIDKKEPIYTGIEIKNVSIEGYDVYVYGIEDKESGINRVQFPTWTEKDGKDDIQENWETNSKATGEKQEDGTTWIYHVKISDHNYEAGRYYTQVHIYDNAGNTIQPYEKLVTVPSIKITYVENEDKQTVYEKGYGDILGTLPEIEIGKEGYTFNGWFTDPSGGEQISSSTKVPADNVTYYAHWIDITPPTKPIITNSSNGNWTNEDVIITLKSTDTGSGIDHYEWYENGEWTTRALTTKNDEGKITYTVNRNETIRFRALDKAGNISEEATTDVRIDKISPTVTINPNGDNTKELSILHVGDYVDYNPTSASTYTASSNYTGHTADQSVSQENLKWQIYSINDDGTIDLVAKPTNTTLALSGVLGYQNGVYILNDISEKLYSNTTYGVTARNISLLDIEKHLTPTGISARDSYSSTYGSYGEKRTFGKDKSYYPFIYRYENGAGINTDTVITGQMGLSDSNYGDLIPTTQTYRQANTNGLTSVMTYYNIQKNSTCYGNVAELLKSEVNGIDNYWIASRFVLHSEDTSNYGIRFEKSTSSGASIYYSDNRSSTLELALRPMVTLKNNVKIIRCVGANSESNMHTISTDTSVESESIQFNTTLTVNDNGGSGLKEPYKYAWTTSNSDEPTEWKTFANEQEVSTDKITETGIWYLWVKLEDNAGNIKTEISKEFEVLERTELKVSSASSENYVGFENNLTAKVIGGKASEVTSYKWYYQLQEGSQTLGSTESTYAVTFDTAGTYMITCIGLDNMGNEVVRGTKQITIANIPTLSIKRSTDTSAIGSAVIVEGNSTTFEFVVGSPISTISSFQWYYTTSESATAGTGTKLGTGRVQQYTFEYDTAAEAYISCTAKVSYGGSTTTLTSNKVKIVVRPANYKMNNTYYYLLSDAHEQANNGSEIQLIRDHAETAESNIIINKNVTLKLMGQGYNKTSETSVTAHTLTLGKSGIYIKDGTLTVDGTGTIQTTTAATATAVIFNNAGTFNLKNGTIRSVNAERAVYITGGGRMTFSGGTIRSNSTTKAKASLYINSGSSISFTSGSCVNDNGNSGYCYYNSNDGTSYTGTYTK